MSNPHTTDGGGLAPSDCLICMTPIRKPWTPPTKCPCKPFIHERCWNTWVRHNGASICVICRNIPEHRPRPLAGIIMIAAPPQVRAQAHPLYHRFVIVYAPWLTMGFVVLTLIWLQFQTRRAHFRPLTAGLPPKFPIPSPFPLLLNTHDEL